MGLTFKKRDDFDKVLETFGVSNIDIITNPDELTGEKSKEDPFAKFLEPKADKTASSTEQTPKN